MPKRKFNEIATDIIRQQWNTQIVSIDDEESILAVLDDLYVELKQKEDGVYWLYKKSEKEIEMFEEQVSKMKKYIVSLKKGQERIKGLVITTHSEIGKLPKHSIFNPIRIQNSAGAVDIINEGAIPEEYWIIVESRKLDKRRILDELKSGTNIPGVRLKIKSFVNGLK